MFETIGKRPCLDRIVYGPDLQLELAYTDRDSAPGPGDIIHPSSTIGETKPNHQ